MALYVSLDGGATWQTRTAGGVIGYANALAIERQNDNHVYLGGSIAAHPALFRSDNRGEEWTEITGSISGIITSLAVDPVSGSRVYAGTLSGVYRSDNGGSSWSKISSFDAACLKINPLRPSEVFAGGASGMFRSLNFGDTWISFSGDMPISQVSCFDMNADVGILYAGTMSGGIYKKNTSDLLTLIIRARRGGTTIPASGTYFYSPGTALEIEAVPDAGYKFAGWTGSIEGIANRLTIIMDTDKAAIANFAVNIFAPLNFTGVKKVNRSLLLAQYVNILEWQPHPDNLGIKSYRIYQLNGDGLSLVAEVNSGMFEYWHKNVLKDQVYQYAICAVNDQDQEGEFAHVEVK